MNKVDKFRFYKDNSGSWRWSRSAPNGEVVGASTQGYSRKKYCFNNAKRNGFPGLYGEVVWEPKISFFKEPKTPADIMSFPYDEARGHIAGMSQETAGQLAKQFQEIRETTADSNKISADIRKLLEDL